MNAQTPKIVQHVAGQTLKERIEAHAAKMARDKARLDNLVSKDKKAERQADSRRKIIIGAAVIGEMDRDPHFRQRVRSLLENAVTRPHDRAAIASLLEARPHQPAANTDTLPADVLPDVSSG